MWSETTDLQKHSWFRLHALRSYGLDQASHCFSDIPLGFAEIQTFLDSWGFLQNFLVAFPACWIGLDLKPGTKLSHPMTDRSPVGVGGLTLGIAGEVKPVLDKKN